jgi:diadenosine tetraphosphate (Ap4A) HIT family hydrolase
MIIDDCFSCEQTPRLADLPIRDRMYNDGLWRLAHALNCALPGWLVLPPLRHVESLADLTADEAGALGLLLQRVSVAVGEVVGCAKTYVALYAELPRFRHLHFHIIPRAHIGAAVAELLIGQSPGP